MTVSTSRCRTLATLCGLACTFAVPAQVPLGHAIVGTFSGPNSAGTAGLFHFPVAGGPVTTITGLPWSYLASTGPQFFHQGFSSVAYRSEDGAILAGTVARVGGPTAGAIELFVFYLSGAAVVPALTQQIWLGDATAGVGGAWVATLPDGRILVAASDAGGPLAVGPMAGSVLAIVDISVSPATITPLPNPPGGGGAGAVDPDGRWLYYFTNTGPAGGASLYRLELATNTEAVIASWLGHVGNGVACDDDGKVYVSTSDLATTTHFTHAVQPNGFSPATVTSTTMDPLAVAPSGLALDRVLGQYLVQGAGFAPGFPNANRNTVSRVDPTTGAATWLAGSPDGWGTLGVGPAVNHVIKGYGAATDGLNHYWFENFPNPGGQPTLGNAGFSLTVAWAPNGAVVSAMALSLGRGSLQIAGIEVLVDPISIVLSPLPLLPLLPTATYPLPIPANPGLAGLGITAQSLHIESGGGLAASRGLQLTIQ